MALDMTSAWFAYADHAGQPRASVTTGDMTADGASASPVANIVDRYIYRAWQSPTEDEYFEIDFGADVSIQCLMVVFPRITNPYRKYDTQEILPTDLIRHLIDADGGTPGTGAVLDTGTIACGALATRGYSCAALATAVTGRYWRCRITANSRAAAGFFLVSLAMAAPIFQPAFNHVFGERIGFPDNAEVQRTPTSQTSFVTRNERTLRASLVWDFFKDSERASWEAMAEYSGTTEPVIFSVANDSLSPFTSATGPSGWIAQGDKIFVGLFEDDAGITSRQLNANIKQVQLMEHR